ncbi:tRNA lysidine(34) synthetase TilS [uncultured Methylobacterium sp.]|uniref:tRNA lysidine(34) synthetase TilS n=1 Tax=uncultured Methylobacterium sp. TaxID=157278 RepID=UPI0035CB7705
MSADRSGDPPAECPLARVLQPFLDDGAPVVLAVSGGPDSTALMHAAAMSGRTGLFVATVDHRLRPESAREAERVGSAATRLGLPHATLVWSGSKPSTGIAAAARAARYRLLADHARSVGAGLVLTGHTRDDQAETVLMRLIAGSGPAGLAAMAPVRDLAPTVRLGRPFLTLPKADLVAYCEGHGLAYDHDPSNRDDRFGRARLRRLMPHLAREGLTAERLCRLAQRSARDEAALALAGRAALAAASVPGDGDLVLDGATLLALPEAVLLRVVGEALVRTGAGGAVRLERLERLVLQDLVPAMRTGAAIRRTLAGILVSVTRQRAVTFGIAPARRTASQPLDGGLAAGPPDLLGKGGLAAYIGSACQD